MLCPYWARKPCLMIAVLLKPNSRFTFTLNGLGQAVPDKVFPLLAAVSMVYKLYLALATYSMQRCVQGLPSAARIKMRWAECCSAILVVLYVYH